VIYGRGRRKAPKHRPRSHEVRERINKNPSGAEGFELEGGGGLGWKRARETRGTMRLRSEICCAVGPKNKLSGERIMD